jgi:hypothetical protein
MGASYRSALSRTWRMILSVWKMYWGTTFNFTVKEATSYTYIILP